ncbi:MAG: SlyX family protein [Planctomycetaceae bacterium]
MSSSDSVNQRVIELETVIAHLQHAFDQLNQVVLRQQAELDDLRQLLGRFEARLTEVAEGPEKRDAAQERPPHY